MTKLTMYQHFGQIVSKSLWPLFVVIGTEIALSAVVPVFRHYPALLLILSVVGVGGWTTHRHFITQD